MCIGIDRRCISAEATFKFYQRLGPRNGVIQSLQSGLASFCILLYYLWLRTTYFQHTSSVSIKFWLFRFIAKNSEYRQNTLFGTIYAKADAIKLSQPRNLRLKTLNLRFIYTTPQF